MFVKRCHEVTHYLENTDIPSQLPDELSTHLVNCPACRKEWEEVRHKHFLLERGAGVLEASRRNIGPVPEGFLEKLDRRIRVSPPATTPLSEPRWKWALAFALVAALGGGYFWEGSRRKPTPVQIAGNAPPSTATKIRISPGGKKPAPTISKGPGKAHAPVQATSPVSGHGVRLPGQKLKGKTSGPPPKATFFSPGTGTKVFSPGKGIRIYSPGPGSGGHVEVGVPPNHAPAPRPPKKPKPTDKDRSSRKIPPAVHAEDDLAYVNPLAAFQPEVEHKIERTLAKGDDFISIPLPTLAAAPSPQTNRLVQDALDRYNQEKAVVDERLFKKIDVEMKAGDLGALMQTLTQQTGVRFYVSKDLEDMKLTVLVKQLPVRDLMRQIVRLFNLEWRRRGEDGKYTYQLVQTLKQKLAEEEMKRKDEDETVLDAAEKLEAFKDYQDMSADQLRSLAEEAKNKAAIAGSVEERQRLLDQQRLFEILSNPIGKDAFHLFSRLTPDQLMKLRRGEKVTFVHDGSPDGLPDDVFKRILSNFGGSVRFGPQFNGKRLDQLPPENIYAAGEVSLDCGWPGRAVLTASLNYSYKEGSELGAGYGLPTVLGTGEPERLNHPSNAARHVALKNDSRYKEKLALDPQPENPLNPKNDPALESELTRLSFTVENNFNTVPTAPDATEPKEWVDTADLFEELHRKSGKNILADYYLRIYPRSQFKTEGALLDVLNDLGDRLKSEWDEETDVVRFRRLNYYAEREMDAPNRLLKKWSLDLKNDGTLSPEDYVEMSRLPKPLLWTPEFKRAALLKWGITGWSIPQYAGWMLNFYDKLTPEQKALVQSDEGLPFFQLTPEQRPDAIKVGFAPNEGEDPTASQNRLYVRVRSKGWYVWKPTPPDRIYDRPYFPGQEPVRAKTREDAQKAVDDYLKDHPMPQNPGAPPARYDVEGPGSSLWFGLSKEGKYRTIEFWAGAG